MKMKKISIYCVNYNSYEYLLDFLCSVEKAADRVANGVVVTVFVGDNTEKDVKPIEVNSTFITVKVFAYNKNLGYFGAVKRMMMETKPEEFDFVIISNVDVVLKADALSVLLGSYGGNCQCIGWIAPQIYSEAEHRDRNPKIVNRYTLGRLKMLRMMFKYPMLRYLYNNTFYKRKKLQTHEPGVIYGGHGSFIILTKEYIEQCGKIDYPIFLFGEELYLAEQCRSKGLTVVYDPQIKIVDMEHSSTGKMTSRFYNRCNVEALEYIIRAFY